MDGRMGLKYWLSQSVLLAGALVLPLIPFLITFATYPGMPTALRQELTEEAKQYEPFSQGIELTIPVSHANDSMGGGDEYGGGYDDEYSDGYGGGYDTMEDNPDSTPSNSDTRAEPEVDERDTNSQTKNEFNGFGESVSCLLYTSPSPRDQRGSRMPSSA